MTDRPDPAAPTLRLRGAEVHKGFLDPPAQAAILAAIARVAKAAPYFTPQTSRGRPMSVRMTSAGRYGWYSDRRGYRYVDRHPGGGAWPPIPAEVRDVWDRVTGLDRAPDCCLVNLYRDRARMGLHQDRDEADFGWPVVSVSLGDDGLFRIGGTTRGGATGSVWLQSGDVVVLGGAARLAYHGIDRIRPGTSRLVPGGGRINLTLRVVD